MKNLNEYRKTKRFNISGCHLENAARVRDYLYANNYSLIGIAGDEDNLNLFTVRVLREHALLDLIVEVYGSNVSIIETDTVLEAV